MTKPEENETIASRLFRGGITGVISGLGVLAAHKFLSVLDQLSEREAQAIAVGLALLCVFFVVFPVMRRRRAVEKQR